MRASARGFTIVEALVALFVASVVILALYQIWIGATKQEEGNLARIESFQTAQLVMDRLHTELAALYLKTPTDLGPFADTSERDGLEFETTVAVPNDASTLYKPEKLTYKLEPDSSGKFSWLLRNGKPLANVKLKSLKFEPKVVEQTAPGDKKLYFMQVRLQAVDRGGNNPTDLVNFVLATALSEGKAHPEWPGDAVPYKE